MIGKRKGGRRRKKRGWPSRPQGTLGPMMKFLVTTIRERFVLMEVEKLS